uniref:Uncharacterized protein n=1 Tax=Cacopsylla melanoneura TaxID=428564 RepID=A0A8D8LNR7_9HEMI
MRTSHILKIRRPSQILKIPRTPQIQKYSEHHFKNTQKTPQIIKIIRLLSIGMYTKNSENTENTEKKIVLSESQYCPSCQSQYFICTLRGSNPDLLITSLSPYHSATEVVLPYK